MRAFHVSAFVQIATVAGLGSAAFADPVAYRAVELYPLSAPRNTLGATPSQGPELVVAGQAVGSAVISGTPAQGVTEHATAWMPNGTPVDLNPNGFGTSRAVGTNGAQQVGSAAATPLDFSRAFLW